MGRYSPTVLPDSGGEGFAQELASAFDRLQSRRRQKKVDTERTEDRARVSRDSDLTYVDRGGRYGTPPDDAGTTITFPGEPDIPTSLDFSPPQGAQANRAPTSPLDPGSFDDALSNEFARGGPTGSPMPGAGTGGQDESSRPTLSAPIHPGAFDPATRTFGGSPLQFATAQQHTDRTQDRTQGRSVHLGPTGRYTPIDDSHYIDETATPGAERQRDRESNMELAAAFRQNDIHARGESARGLEGERQQGRLQLRDRINAGNMAGILKRGAIAGENQAAHDARVTTRQKEVGARAITEGQREHNAITAAKGVMQAANGDYASALDWLKNTPEGQDAAKNGLQPRHLYAALGDYVEKTTTAATRLQTGAAGMEPEGAVTAVGKTRELVTSKTKRAAAAGPTDDGAAREAWAKSNPPAKGETREQYKARYEASRPKK